MNMIVLDTSAASILGFVWIGSDSVAGITVFAILYGFCAGVYVSLIPPIIVELTPDMRVVGTWLDKSLFIASFGLLIGTPIAGALVNIQKKQFVPAQVFTGAMIFLGGFLLLMALVVHALKLSRGRHKRRDSIWRWKPFHLAR